MRTRTRAQARVHAPTPAPTPAKAPGLLLVLGSAALAAACAPAAGPSAATAPRGLPASTATHTAADPAATPTTATSTAAAPAGPATAASASSATHTAADSAAAPGAQTPGAQPSGAQTSGTATSNAGTSRTGISNAGTPAAAPAATRPGACVHSQLAIHIEPPFGAAAGTSYGDLVLTNVSAATCWVEGSASVVPLDSQRHVVHVALTGPSTRPARVVLKPGDSASEVLGYGSDGVPPPGQSDCGPEEDYFRVTLPGAAEGVEVPGWHREKCPSDAIATSNLVSGASARP